MIELKITDSRYPEKLKQIFDPPEKLYCIGNLDLLNRRSVAIVGSRKCTEYGKMVSYRLAEKLSSNGITVISGLATGIDSFAHKGALASMMSGRTNQSSEGDAYFPMQTAGGTIAVMACGLDICYPKSNKKIFDRIAEVGLLVSENEPGHEARRFDFPLRNRIISGLASSVVIVEAAEGSGSLITAGLALSEGRNVYAVPGNINSTQSLGTNKLIKEGAQPVTTISDVLIDMNIAPKTEKNVIKNLSKDEEVIYELAQSRGEISLEELAFLANFSMAKVKGITTVLEIKGLITTAIGKIYIAK